MTFLKILLAAAPMFLIVALGYVARKSAMVNEESEKSLLQLTINLLFPCFILSRVPGNESLQEPAVVAAALGAGLTITVIGILFVKLVAHRFKITSPEGINTFSVASAIQNYGFLPIPLVEALFPERSAETIGLLLVHNLGVELVIWTLAIVLLSGSFQAAWRRLINGPTIAILLGLILNATGLHQYIPEFVEATLNTVGAAAIPIGLILVGSTFAGVIEKESLKFDVKVITGSIVLRFMILPMLILSAASLLRFSPTLREVLIIEAAMPSAVFPIVLAKHFGGKPSIAVEVCLTTTAVSVILTPLVLMLAFQWFEIAF